jgi:rod shape-determining protein MreB and related proteins
MTPRRHLHGRDVRSMMSGEPSWFPLALVRRTGADKTAEIVCLVDCRTPAETAGLMSPVAGAAADRRTRHPGDHPSERVEELDGRRHACAEDEDLQPVPARAKPLGRKRPRTTVAEATRPGNHSMPMRGSAAHLAATRLGCAHVHVAAAARGRCMCVPGPGSRPDAARSEPRGACARACDALGAGDVRSALPPPVRSEGPALAIDLGSARTQIVVPGIDGVVDEPTHVACTSTGEAIAAGHDAWLATAEGRGRLQSPVRGGVVRDPVSCVHMLRILLSKSGADLALHPDVTLSVAATAHGRDASVLAAVVASVTGGRVFPIEAGLAASIGADLDIAQDVPRLVCDVGAGVTEMAAVANGQVIASVATRLELGAYDTRSEQALRLVERLLRRTLEALPDGAAGDAAAGPLLLVGAGALRSDLIARLGARCRMQVLVPVKPREVVARGLARILTGPLTAA